MECVGPVALRDVGWANAPANQLSLGAVCDYRSTSWLPIPSRSAQIRGTVIITSTTIMERGGFISTSIIRTTPSHASASHWAPIASTSPVNSVMWRSRIWRFTLGSANPSTRRKRGGPPDERQRKFPLHFRVRLRRASGQSSGRYFGFAARRLPDAGP